MPLGLMVSLHPMKIYQFLSSLFENFCRSREISPFKGSAKGEEAADIDLTPKFCWPLQQLLLSTDSSKHLLDNTM